MKKKELYAAPETEVLVISSESLVCASPESTVPDLPESELTW